MNGQDRFEADLRGWLAARAPRSSPEGLVATGMSEVRATPQRRTVGWFFATPLAARVLAAGVVVAGVIASAFLLDLVPVAGPPGASSTPSASPAYDVTCGLADGCDELLPAIRQAVRGVGAQISSVNVDDGTYCLVNPFDPIICGLVGAPDGATYIARARVRFSTDPRQAFLNIYRFVGADGQLSGRVGSDVRLHQPLTPEAPTLTCANPRCEDVIAIVNTAVVSVDHPIRSIDVSTGAYCLGDPFHPIPCPGPYKEGAETIGSAEVTFWGSPLHAFFNLFVDGHGAIIYDMNVLPEPGSTVPPSTPTPSPTPAAPLPGVPSRQVPAASVLTVTNPQGVHLAAAQAWSAYVFFSDGAGSGTLQHVDMRTGARSEIAVPLIAGEVLDEFTPVVTDGQWLVMRVWHRLGPPAEALVPCPTDLTQPQAWRILVAPIDLDGMPSAPFSVFAAGTSERLIAPAPGSPGCEQPSLPNIAISRGEIAYDVEAPTATTPLASTIVVRALADGTVVGTIAADVPPAQLLLDAETVIWTEAADVSADPNGRWHAWMSSADASFPTLAVPMDDATLAMPGPPEREVGGGAVAWTYRPDYLQSTGTVWHVYGSDRTPRQVSPSGLACQLGAESGYTVVLTCSRPPDLPDRVVVWDPGMGLVAISGLNPPAPPLVTSRNVLVGEGFTSSGEPAVYFVSLAFLGG